MRSVAGGEEAGGVDGEAVAGSDSGAAVGSDSEAVVGTASELVVGIASAVDGGWLGTRDEETRDGSLLAGLPP